jgi:hypothetical protein
MAAPDEALISTIRAAAGRLRFESATRGAVVIVRHGHGLPASEAFAELSELDRALASVRRTIRHSHRAHAMVDQRGTGHIVVFGRHVTEGDRRWDFEVQVAVDRQMNAVIADARIERPGDADADGDDPAERRPLPRLTLAELLPFGMVACPCCGHATLSERGAYQICPVCFWEDDGQDSADADEQRGGPNRVSLREGRASYLRSGASVEADRDKVRRPTAEEVPLRRFSDDGREIEPAGGPAAGR